MNKNDKEPEANNSLSDTMEIFGSVFQAETDSFENDVDPEDSCAEQFNTSAELYLNLMGDQPAIDPSKNIWKKLDNKEKIILLLNFMISNRVTIQILPQDNNPAFTSKFIQMIKDEKIPEKLNLIIEKLSPSKGDTIIQSYPKTYIEFLINGNLCRGSLEYIGINNNPPHFGFVLGMPELIEIKEKRKEKRIIYETPEFISMEFSIKTKIQEEKSYELKVLNCSKFGLGALITPKDLDLLKQLKVGDNIGDISLFASWTVIKVNGKITHISRITNESLKGCYLIGISSPDIIESCNPEGNIEN